MRRLATAAALTLALVAGACSSGSKSDEGARPTKPTTTTVACTEAPLAVRAAAVLVVGMDDGTTADGPLTKELLALGVGGIVLRAPNVVDAAQVKALVAGLRAASPHHLFITSDEEGGRVSRLRSVLGATSSPRVLGHSPIAKITETAAARAATVHDLGVDLILGPVVDADGGPADGPIGDRSFDADPTAAAAKAAAFVEGLRSHDVQAVIKHFPGQGGLAEDSHAGTVITDRTKAQVRAAALDFRPALKAGAGAVMVSHVTYSALGPLPASLEPAVYKLLRTLGFDGVAMTDSLGMGSIVQRWTVPQAAVEALKAGADAVLVNQGVQATGMRDAIVAAVQAGTLKEARLDEAVRRMVVLGGGDPATMVCG